MTSMTVVPLSPACGAEIKGVDLTKPLSDAQVAAIKHAWGKHLVLVFRGQTLSQDQQLRFAAYFGELGTRKKAPEKLRHRAEGIQQDHEKVLLVTNIKVDGEPIGAFGDGEFWFHIDSGYSAKPYNYTFLHALELPSTGGNTLFSNMYKAYEAVPPALKAKLKGKRALHIHEYNRAKQASHSGDLSGTPHAYHPVFITHPETRRKSLFVDRLMTVAIEGVDADESAAMLRELYDIGERREFLYEHVWQLGDFLMWDNRCTIHARTDFPKGERRLLRRCTVEGAALYEEPRLPALENFIANLRGVWAAHPDDETRMKAAKPLLEAFVMDESVKAHSRAWPSTEGRKNLRLYVDPDYEFVINAVVRVPGRTGSVHDHADAWVLYGIVDGAESLERYDRIDDASRSGYAEIRLASVTTGTQGKVDLVAPYAIHAEQGGPARSAAVILRSRPLGEGTVLQNSYDAKAKTVTQRYGPEQIPYELRF